MEPQFSGTCDSSPGKSTITIKSLFRPRPQSSALIRLVGSKNGALSCQRRTRN